MAQDKDKQEQISAREFRIWLEGVEEMQDDEWVPSSTQWKRIREKIDTIKDDQVVVESVSVSSTVPQYATPALWDLPPQPSYNMPMNVAPPSHNIFQGGAPRPVDSSGGAYTSEFAT